MTDAATMTAGPLPTGAGRTRACDWLSFAAAAWLMLSGVQKFPDLDAFRALLIEHAVLAGIVPVARGSCRQRSCASACWRSGICARRVIGARAACLGVAAMFALLRSMRRSSRFDPPAKPAGCRCGFSFRFRELDADRGPQHGGAGDAAAVHRVLAWWRGGSVLGVSGHGCGQSRGPAGVTSPRLSSRSRGRCV